VLMLIYYDEAVRSKLILRFFFSLSCACCNHFIYSAIAADRLHTDSAFSHLVDYVTRNTRPAHFFCDTGEAG